jgi:hypothetical protein
LLLQHSLELPHAAAGSKQHELVAMLQPSRVPQDAAAAHCATLEHPQLPLEALQ